MFIRGLTRPGNDLSFIMFFLCVLPYKYTGVLLLFGGAKFVVLGELFPECHMHYRGDDGRNALRNFNCNSFTVIWKNYF